MQNYKRQKCQIQNTVKVICPVCQQIVAVPMCKAVNGDEIECPHCKQHFIFREEESGF